VASILSGARKYALGLTLAHQETRQLKSRSEDVASAVLANAYTRVVFRVGEDDAKALADGFSFFEAADLQSLGVGEAVARIERRDDDFNLRTVPTLSVARDVAKRRRTAIAEASRTAYGTPRAAVEAALEKMRKAVVGTGEPTPSKAATLKRRQRANSVATARELGSSVPLPGRGGPQHKYLQSLVRRLAEDRGFSVEVEKRILDGHGHVDVLLERAGLRVGVEISITTDAAHEVDNLGKCLAAGCDYAVLVSTDAPTLEAARSMIVGPTLRQMRFLTPETLMAFLETLVSSGNTGLARRRKGQGSVQRGSEREDATPSAAVKRAMLLTRDAAAYIGLAQQTLAKMRWSGDSPPYFKVGRQVVYDRADLDAWLAERKRRSTSDVGGTA
jgi:predicted DNA-binding transcriptional regulator AlpA